MKIVGKKLNKIIIGAIIGSAILGITGYSMGNKKKSLIQRIKEKFKAFVDFLSLGVNQIKKKIK